ncbi:MAG: hypothetical protein UX41_C0008G0009 [Candidatus Collierbacteria bacterium GW2011_GWE1_46_18]|uniref:Polyprenyl synthetase superfamily n=1 Tax=Candidatus Collierbacteria bacterium GW2011_GWE1_46_18 TaxID=1618399 RepID=A0A0G1PBI9_9BACT|nr:MAG: hypothetical protein UX41_C0008G0009 [Candidatus Collierbacteria bacterium GW2011_GWE1_46_18]
MLNEALGEKAKKTLIGFVEKINPMLEKYWDDEISNSFGFNETQQQLVKKMLLHARSHNLVGGKRIRGAFVYYGYGLGEAVVDERIWKAAMAVELVHTALLMHDDFMDEDKLRRGKPTTHEYFAKGDKHYGEAMAVNVGDAVLCLGYEMLMDCGFESDRVIRAMEKLLRGITNTTYGQAYDVSLPKSGDMTEEKVMSLHKAKTAIYTYENPLFIGGILGGLGEKELSILHEYSMKGGVAFQLQDDILGIYGESEKTGKSDDSDLLQGKSTLLIIKAMEMGNSEQKSAIGDVWGNKVASALQIELAKKAIKDSGSYEYSVKVAKRLAREAVIEARKLREWDMNSNSVDFIEGVAEYMVDREV